MVNFGAEIPFVQHLGFVLELFEAGESAIRYTPLPEHLNSFAVTHGGACMTLLDVAMAVAARSVEKDMGVVTIEMKTSFMRPAPGNGGALIAKGQACAHSTGTFKYVRRRPNDVGSAQLARPIPTD